MSDPQVPIDTESVAGEEDPGASLDTFLDKNGPLSPARAVADGGPARGTPAAASASDTAPDAVRVPKPIP